MTANQINYLRLQEDRAHNRASEETERRKAGAAEGQVRVGFATVGESQRHNQAQEQINWYDAQGRVLASTGQAEAALQQAATAEERAQIERNRAATEALRQQEDARHNRELERIQQSGIDVNSRTQQENARHNKALEDLKLGEIVASTTTDVLDTAQKSVSSSRHDLAGIVRSIIPFAIGGKK